MRRSCSSRGDGEASTRGEKRSYPSLLFAKLANTLVRIGMESTEDELFCNDERAAALGAVARACPPEDCGGAPGYERLLAALADREHEEHREMKEWAPRGFNADKFDPVAVNKKLAALAKGLARGRK